MIATHHLHTVRCGKERMVCFARPASTNQRSRAAIQRQLDVGILDGFNTHPGANRDCFRADLI